MGILSATVVSEHSWGDLCIISDKMYAKLKCRNSGYDRTFSLLGAEKGESILLQYTAGSLEMSDILNYLIKYNSEKPNQKIYNFFTAFDNLE